MSLSRLARFVVAILRLQSFTRILIVGMLAMATHQTGSAQSVLGNALSLNGAIQGVVVSNFGTIIPTNEVTIEFWAYTTKVAQQSAVMLYPDANSNRFNIHLNYGGSGDGAIYWDFANTAGNVGRLGNVPAPTNSISNWVHYAFVASQSANSMSIYTNGVLYTNKTGRSTFVRGTYDLMIGCASNYPYRGTLDDLRIWSAARSAAEIQANYQTPLVGNEANLLLYYKFDSTNGTIATNSATVTGATYNGTLTNNPTWVVNSLSAPTATTLSVTGNSNTVAQLNGSVTTTAAALVWFEWGLFTTNNTNTTTPVTANGSGSIGVSNVVSGLIPGRIYHCQIVASNWLGVARGKDVMFGAPSVVLNSAAPLTNECHAALIDPNPITATGMPLSISSGGIHNLALRTDGTVSVWGANNLLQTNVPANLSNVVAVSAGFGHSLALKKDGTVVAWGDNTYQQTNVPAGLTNVVAVAAGQNHSVALKSNGTVIAWGNNGNPTTTNSPAGLTNAMAIAAGQAFTMAIASNGTVVVWGDNAYNQTNVPVGLSNVVAIAAGYHHGLALKIDGTVTAWGAGTNASGTNSNFGQSMVPGGLTNVIAIDSGEVFSAALKSDGTVVAWGDNTYSQTTIPANVTNVVALAVGDRHCLATKADGTVVGWGLTTQTITTFPSTATNLTLAVTAGGAFNTNNSPGSYSLTYFVTNSLGGTGTVSRTVVVKDSTPPVITLLGQNPLTNFLNVPLSDPGATALDACGGSFAVSSNNNVNVGVAGSYTITYTSTDSYTNSANVLRTVLVVGPPTYSGFTATVIGTNAANGARTVQFTAGVNPNGIDSSVNFQFGLTSAYAGTNGPVSVPASFNTGNVTVTVPGFSSGVTYHWNVAGTNAVGSSSSSDQTFTIGTLPGSGIPGDIDGDGFVSKAELDAVYGNYVTNSPWLYMTNVTGLDGTNVTFSLTNSAGGVNFTVEYTTNLVEWHELGAATPRFEFNDTNAPASPVRHYRLRYP